jgi:hypothetical protein
MKPVGRVRGRASMMWGKIGNGGRGWKALGGTASLALRRRARYAAGGGGGGFGGLGGGGLGGLGCRMATRKVK